MSKGFRWEREVFILWRLSERCCWGEFWTISGGMGKE